VSDGLDSASVVIDVSDRRRAKDAKGIEALGRKVDVSGRIERRLRDKKHVLRLDETASNVVDHGTGFAHDYS
jgi:hypothetical protein